MTKETRKGDNRTGALTSGTRAAKQPAEAAPELEAMSIEELLGYPLNGAGQEVLYRKLREAGIDPDAECHPDTTPGKRSGRGHAGR
jgi:hypothetical protein